MNVVAEATLTCIALSEIRQTYSTFIILIVIIIIIIIIITVIIIIIFTIIIAIISSSLEGDNWDMDDLFHKWTNFREQSSKPSKHIY